MLISTKGRYSLRIMLDVAQNGKDCAVKISEIAARQEISIKYTEQLAAALTKAGLLRSVRGAGGGYLLTKAANDYSVYEILQHTEGELVPVECVLREGYCNRASCAVRGLWNGLYGVMRDYLEKISLGDIMEGKTV
ncbi:MAG: Rrf2 family transcriptional regulator [Clostridia bacterium]|nr:Rrf2 family transcriptional regulator [Clostridia bacterium]